MKINKTIRAKIADILETIIITDYVSLKDAIRTYIPLIYDDYNSENIEKRIIAYSITIICFLDAYKMHVYKQKQLISKNIEIEELAELTSVDNVDTLINKAKQDFNFLGMLIESSYSFNELNEMSKITLLKSLSKEENKFLSSISELHIEDIKEYDRLIDREDILTFAKEQRKHYHKFLMINFELGEIYQLANFIKMLIDIEDKSVKDIVTELINIDYKLSYYLIDKVDDKDTLKNHIEIYETLSFEEIINYLRVNQDFLIDVVWMYIDYKINKQYNEIKLPNIEEDTSHKLTLN